MTASLTNNTGKRIRHVGVLAGAMEYEFDVRLAPYASIDHATGTLYDPNDHQYIQNGAWKKDTGCWARAVEFDDGTVWGVSPL